MVGEKKMTGQNGRQRLPPAATLHNAKRLSHRVLSLMELQGRLLKMDLQEGLHSLVVPLALLFGGVVFAFSFAQLLLVTVAHALRQWAELSWAAAYLSAALLALAMAAAATWIGLRLLQRRWNVCNRSMQEFNTNVAWLKKSLKQEEIPDRVSDSA